MLSQFGRRRAGCAGATLQRALRTANLGSEPRVAGWYHRQAQHTAKDNAFTSLDFRVARNFKFSECFTLQGAIDTFNLLNNKNLKKPEATGLLFNFDGTLQSGLGDPRQAQLGVKLIFY